MTQEVVSVIEMTFLYDAGYSVVLLRPKNDVKPPKCRKVDLYGEMTSVKFSGIYSPRSRNPLCTGVFPPARTVP